MPRILKKRQVVFYDITWSTLADGKQRVFEAGKDFAEGNQNSVRSQSHYEARVRRFKSRTRARGFDLVIQWFPLPDSSSDKSKAS